jgi:hypothetical protein
MGHWAAEYFLEGRTILAMDTDDNADVELSQQPGISFLYSAS